MENERDNWNVISTSAQPLYSANRERANTSDQQRGTERMLKKFILGLQTFSFPPEVSPLKLPSFLTWKWTFRQEKYFIYCAEASGQRVIIKTRRKSLLQRQQHQHWELSASERWVILWSSWSLQLSLGSLLIWEVRSHSTENCTAHARMRWGASLGPDVSQSGASALS